MKANAAADGGFTLVELMVVLAIIGVLVTISVTSYLHYKDQANDAVAHANVHEATVSIESYYADNKTYLGMTLGALHQDYDQALDPSRYVLNGLTADTYCISSTVGGQSWRKDGPGQDDEKGSC